MLMHILYIRHMFNHHWTCIYLGYDTDIANHIAKAALPYFHIAYYTRLNNDSINYKVW